jgi:putative FmdB family regulatory protein
VPIFDYECGDCGQRFEAIVLPGAPPACPACHSVNLNKLVSSAAVSTSGTRKLSLSSAQKKNAGVARDKAWTDAEYDRKHRHE